MESAIAQAVDCLILLKYVRPMRDRFERGAGSAIKADSYWWDGRPQVTLHQNYYYCYYQLHL